MTLQVQGRHPKPPGKWGRTRTVSEMRTDLELAPAQGVRGDPGVLGSLPPRLWGLGKGCGGRGAATRRRPGARGCVLPGPRRTQDLRRRTRVQLRVRNGRSHRSAGGPAAACPSPAAHCGGTRARLRRPAVPSGAVRFYRRRRRLRVLLRAVPGRCFRASPCSFSCRRRRRLVPTAPIAAAATTAAPADPARRYSPPRKPHSLAHLPCQARTAHLSAAGDDWRARSQPVASVG